MTYSDLVARLQAFTSNDVVTDADWATAVPGIVEQAELRCYRDVDFLAVRQTVLVTLAAGSPTLTPPADWLLGQGIRLTATNQALDRRDQTFVNEYSTGQGTPKYWADLNSRQILLSPIPSLNTAAELTYHSRPAPLSPTNTSTWLAANLPDLLFYAAMVAATGYLKNFGAQADDPKMAMSWEQQYQTALRSALREEGRRKGDNSFDSSQAPPPSSNMPQ